MTQKHIFLIVLAGLWGFLHKAMTSLQSDHSARPIRTQRRARLHMIPSGIGALPRAGDSKCHLRVCLRVLCGSVHAQNKTSNTQRHTRTHAHKKSNTPQTALFVLPIPLKVHPRPNESEMDCVRLFNLSPSWTI